MTPVRILPAAEAELLHEVQHYSTARAGTGVRFQAAVEAALERASRHPLGGAPSAKGTRSVLVKGFPFSIVYRASPAELLVVAIAPHRRRPGYWVARIGVGQPFARADAHPQGTWAAKRPVSSSTSRPKRPAAGRRSA